MNLRVVGGAPNIIAKHNRKENANLLNMATEAFLMRLNHNLASLKLRPVRSNTIDNLIGNKGKIYKLGVAQFLDINIRDHKQFLDSQLSQIIEGFNKQYKNVVVRKVEESDPDNVHQLVEDFSPNSSDHLNIGFLVRFTEQPDDTGAPSTGDITTLYQKAA